MPREATTQSASSPPRWPCGLQACHRKSEVAVGGTVEGCWCCGRHCGCPSNAGQWNYQMVQQFHFWVRGQKNCRQCPAPQFTAAALTGAKRGKLPKCPSTDDYMKCVYTCTMTFYLTLKKKGSLITRTTWVSPEAVLLTEIIQTHEGGPVRPLVRATRVVRSARGSR